MNKAIELLKIKHLFYSSLRHKINFKAALGCTGLKALPESIEALESLNLTETDIGVINSLYSAQRSIDETDPHSKIKYDTLVGVDNLKVAFRAGGLTINPQDH